MVALEPGGTELEAGELVHWWLPQRPGTWEGPGLRFPKMQAWGLGSESGVCL